MKPCFFMACTNSGPYRVEGHFLMHEGLAVALHLGYGRDLESSGLYATEYLTGMPVANGPRSEILRRISSVLIAEGGANSYVKKLRQDLLSYWHGSIGLRGKSFLNTELLPSGYLLS